MTSKRPYLPLFVADYRADTHHLTLTQHGAYLLLLMAVWNDPDGSLPNDSAMLSRICGMSHDRRNWVRTLRAVMPFFEVVGDRLRHKRIDKEIARLDAIAEARAAGGKLGGRPPDTRISRRASPDAPHEPDLFNENGANENLKVSPRARANSDSRYLSESPDGDSFEDARAGAHKPTPRSVLRESLSSETVEALLAHRKALKKPMTARAAELLLPKLLAAKAECGLSPEQAVDTMIERGWQGFSSEWVLNATRGARDSPAQKSHSEEIDDWVKRVREEEERRAG